MKTSPDIKNIEYVSKGDAFDAFSKRHEGNQVLEKALEQVGDNPFLASLNITTNGDPIQYESVSNILQTSDFSKLIDKVDFSQKKDTIEKVYSITSNINRFGIIFGIILIIIAMLVVHNTIKLAVETSKDEISTMRIVGASNWFIRGPFIIQGIIYGVIAFLVCILLSGLSAYFLSSEISSVLPGFSASRYFLTNFWILVLIQLGFGIGVGIISSFIVVRKYLEI
jgi:cell division transport system permease protein